MHTRRVASTCTTTELAVGWNGRGLRFDADGRGEPHGYTVTNPRPGASTAVTLRATASASTGTALDAARSSTAMQPAPTGAVVRVSISRAGMIGWKPRGSVPPRAASGAGPAQPSACAARGAAGPDTPTSAARIAVMTTNAQRRRLIERA